MRHIFLLLIALISIFFTSPGAAAQEKQKAKISSIYNKDSITVIISVTSSREFYVGSNTHILYIGDKQYDLNEQINEDGRGMINFFVPSAEFETLNNGTRVYLSYGELVIPEGEKAEDLCRQNFCPCWSLGKLNKKMLK